MNDRRLTLVLLGLTLLALALATPASYREAVERGQFYVFTSSFLADIPKRLTGPGRFRFLLQPTVAALLGLRDGRADAQAGRSPYIASLVFGTGGRAQLMKTGLRAVANLLLMGILLDTCFQWVILGTAYPGAALVVGPVLITVPYALARALANRAARAFPRG